MNTSQADEDRTMQLQPIHDGPADAHTLVFVQGWPDDASVWDAQVEALAQRYHCVRTTLPNHGGDRSDRWGHDTETIAAALAEHVRNVANRGRVTLVLHDWGCYWGHLMHHRNPELVARVVGLDVAPHFQPDANAALGIVAYQSWLWAAFVLGGPLGDRMTRAMAARAGAPGEPERMNAWMNYPYRNVWLDLASGRYRRSMADYWPQIPLLFAYGRDKPFPFHSSAWTDHVRSVGGEVVGLECGHWVQRHPELTGILSRWLEATAGAEGVTPDAK